MTDKPLLWIFLKLSCRVISVSNQISPVLREVGLLAYSKLLDDLVKEFKDFLMEFEEDTDPKIDLFEVEITSVWKKLGSECDDQ